MVQYDEEQNKPHQLDVKQKRRLNGIWLGLTLLITIFIMIFLLNRLMSSGDAVPPTNVEVSPAPVVE